MEEDILFCTTCGGKMDPNSSFCPACGTSVTTVHGTDHLPSQRSSAEQWEADSKLKTVRTLLILGTVVSFIVGLICLAAVDIMAEVYENIYTNVSLQELQDTVKTIGYAYFACGVMCIIPAVIVMKRISWVLAFVLTLIATLIGFYVSLIGGLLGLLCLYYIYKYRIAFE
jgi:hypothetical protein